MHEAVIEKLRGEQLCHKNDLTGCEIWTGDFNRAHEPVMAKVNAREYMYQAASGEVVTRGESVKMLCENDACILPAHMRKEEKKRKEKEPINEEDVRKVNEQYFGRGLRVDAIAEAEGWTKPYVTRLVAEARSRRGASQ